MNEQDPMSEGSVPDTAPTTPMLRVISGNPSAEEIAALVAVVSALGSGAAGAGAGEPVATDQWATPARLHRAAVHPGPIGSWWASGLPR